MPGNVSAVVKRNISLGATAIQIWRDDRLVLDAGDATVPVNVRSVRKSLLSALYGIAVSRGLIGLGQSLAELGIDDRKGLTPREKRATVRDLLMARGGIYHAAAYESAATMASHPSRDTHAPGEAWHYANWGFNALGTIYESQTGRDVFSAFNEQIAIPIGMQDFDRRTCQALFEPVSDHPAHTFYVSARDLARFGRLFLGQGRWSGLEVVPTAWVAQSTKALSETGRPLPGYGYLWWVLGESDPLGPGAFAAIGTGGQGLAVIPSRRLVVAQVVDAAEGQERMQIADFLSLLWAADSA